MAPVDGSMQRPATSTEGHQEPSELPEQRGSGWTRWRPGGEAPFAPVEAFGHAAVALLLVAACVTTVITGEWGYATLALAWLVVPSLVLIAQLRAGSRPRWRGLIRIFC